MVFDPTQFPRVLTIYLELSNYPILAPQIRERMREELFKRTVITSEDFEKEVEQKAKESQYREGLTDPSFLEPTDLWLNRKGIIRDNLTDFYFAYNLPHDAFEQIVREVLETRIPSKEFVLTFHPELAPWDMLFAQGEAYEAIPPEEQGPIEHHLEEIKVVLIKAMISDHLDYIGIAKEWLDISDLQHIRGRRFGRGKIGGKAAGIVLAEAILRKSAIPGLSDRFAIPQSWFLGSDVFYQFTHLNDLLVFSNQKYKSEQEIRNEFPNIKETFFSAAFPDDIVDGLKSILEEVGSSPLIVRSSSLLEDSFGTSFAGKYESHFCGNQGSPEENLRSLYAAIGSIYASLYSPDVILYRKKMKLVDYDERMAILIQRVVGHKHDNYFMPAAAGVGFSCNQFRWNPQIDRNMGFLRLVWGLGTRAVNRYGGDYPRLVALSHPQLRPESDPAHIRLYSQNKIDFIDLEENTLQTFPVTDMINNRTPHLRLIANQFVDEHLRDYISLPLKFDPNQAVITFNGLLRDTDFPELMRKTLHTLEKAYGRPVDTEFAVEVDVDETGKARPFVYMVQCRPQSQLLSEGTPLPKDIPESQIIFTSHGMVSDGEKSDIRFAVYIHDESYYALNPENQIALARLIGKINNKLANESFILIGPGRWGSVNPELGISVQYGDLYNTCALVEVVSEDIAIEPSYGTHFFQDLIEAGIFILAISLDDSLTKFNQSFFLESENLLDHLLPEETRWSEVVRIIDVHNATGGISIKLVADGDASIAIAYLDA
jgi:hypothetical protein